ncbi:uncharacterized protein LDX57_002686 [Aspergillus melleus]|uniref:uncharacterized protein n=1 Tax=Aspergillus melleus TaxID=138277 RepID=UPI001E8CDF64|nr:uncharacterized protein LDX57_002686 [Aspergillus melleus]KAH8424940.1 hypothetical protein LDX57_002686 [Aspergillus melleus]
MPKDSVFSLLTPTGMPTILTADRATHSRQRRLLSHTFSEKALREQGDIIEGYVNRLMPQFSSLADGGSINVSAWFNYFASIRRNPGPLLRRTLQLHGNWHSRRIRLLASRHIQIAHPIPNADLTWPSRFFMLRSASGVRARNINRVVDTVTRRIELVTDRKDFLHYILAAMESDKGMTRDEINMNAFSFSISGSEDTATALAAFVF